MVRFVKSSWFALLVMATITPGAGLNPSAPSGLYHYDDGLVCTDCHSVESPYPQHLKKADHTDLCLSCHMEGNNTSATTTLDGVAPGGWTAPIVMSWDCRFGQPNSIANISMPAGDFCFSNLDPLNGHNPAFTLNATGPTSSLIYPDPRERIAPGGNGAPVKSMAGEEWSCLSCHAAHSRFAPQVAPWRQLLRSVNGIVTSGCDQTNGTVETNGNCSSQTAVTAPQYEALKSNSRGDVRSGTIVNRRADGNPLEGADLSQPYGDKNKNVYRGGFSSFCIACHLNVHGSGSAALTRQRGALTGSDTGSAWAAAASHSHNVGVGYNHPVSNLQGTNPNPVGYDWRYPLVQPDKNFIVSANLPSATDPGSVLEGDRITCLTCHNAHASSFKNMTRWDTRTHAALLAGEIDPFTGRPAADDNPAVGCQKCHQMGGTAAYVRRF